MNVITAEVKEIVTNGRVNLVKFGFGKETINMLMLEMNLDLKVGARAELIIKPTSISVLNDFCDFENIFKAKVVEVTEGEILANVTVEVNSVIIEAVTLKKRFKNEVFIAFKSNDIAVLRVLND
jgi:molybdopterin-binding protein